MSFAQQRLWFIIQMEGPSPTCNVALVFRISGGLNTDILRRAMDDVVGRHDALRTVFPEHEGVPYQRIIDAADADILVDICPATEHTVMDAVDRACHYTFDLSSELLFRAA